ncbi:hypothetical protein MDAP_001083 [Mitosporidium daphniae]
MNLQKLVFVITFVSILVLPSLQLQKERKIFQNPLLFKTVNQFRLYTDDIIQELENLNSRSLKDLIVQQFENVKICLENEDFELAIYYMPTPDSIKKLGSEHIQLFDIKKKYLNAQLAILFLGLKVFENRVKIGQSWKIKQAFILLEGMEGEIAQSSKRSESAENKLKTDFQDIEKITENPNFQKTLKILKNLKDSNDKKYERQETAIDDLKKLKTKDSYHSSSRKFLTYLEGQDAGDGRNKNEIKISKEFFEILVNLRCQDFYILEDFIIRSNCLTDHVRKEREKALETLQNIILEISPEYLSPQPQKKKRKLSKASDKPSEVLKQQNAPI